MTIIKDNLPDTFGELLHLALDDLEKVESMKGRFAVRMNQWHIPPDGDVKLCQVCLGGAVLAMTSGLPDDVDYYAIENNDDLHRKLCALSDAALMGAGFGFDTFYNGKRSKEGNYISYKGDPTAFKANLRTFADECVKEGV